MGKWEEPKLEYQPEKGLWVGANTQFSIWMNDATFLAYVASWYEWTRWLPDHPPAERRAAAVAHCQRVSYWSGCEKNYDLRVHIRYL